MARIAIVSASLGAGHDGAAHEIGRRLRESGHDVTCYDFLDLMPYRLGRWLRGVYRRQLDVAPSSWEWLLRVMQRYRGAAAVAIWLSIMSGRGVLRAVGPDVDAVVSTYPLASQAVVRLRRRGRLTAPLVTYLTDPSVHTLWMADGTDLYLAAHPEIAEQVRALGARHVAVVAPAVRPEFRPPGSAEERAAARARFDLPADGLLALVISGSWAVGDIEQSAREVAQDGTAIPVVVCGVNDALRERLRDLQPGIVLGWVDDMPTLLRACDVVVLNSGGLTFFEAHATGLPVLTYRCLAGHGLTNARSLESAGLARWQRSFDELAAALRRLPAPSRPVTTSTVATSVGTICPTVAIAGLLDRPTTVSVEAPSHRRPRKLAIWATALTCLLWMCTGGTSLAVAHGFRAVDSRPGTSHAVYFVIDVPPNQTVTDQDLAAMAQLRAAIAVSVSTATRNPDLVRRMADAGLLVVNSAGGQPYRTGFFTGRSAIGAGAREITRLTSNRPNMMLSDGDVDAVDVGLASLYGERIVVPSATVGCTASVTLPVNGGVVLVRPTRHGQCDLSATMARLSDLAIRQNLHPTPLKDVPL